MGLRLLPIKSGLKASYPPSGSPCLQQRVSVPPMARSHAGHQGYLFRMPPPKILSSTCHFIHVSCERYLVLFIYFLFWYLVLIQPHPPVARWALEWAPHPS